jgi:multidrug efflux pump subunit AcrA (membrane-fusion protein)
MKRQIFLIVVFAALLSGCGGTGILPTATPLPTLVLDNGTPDPANSPQTGSGITASGVVVPAQQTRLSASISANVREVNAAIQDEVEAGQVLVSLTGEEQAQAALSAAELEMLVAQQELDRYKETAGLVSALAQQRLATAQKAYDDAARKRDSLYRRRGSDEQIAAANANYILAQDKAENLESIYNNTLGLSEDDPKRALALANLENARKERDRAKVNLNWYKGQATEQEVAEGEAALAVAAADLADAQLVWDRVKDGPDVEQVAVLEARRKNAEAQVAAAQANLANLEIIAPFQGTVLERAVEVGEWVIPGQPVLVLADLSHLRVETTDLSERDVPQVKKGQAVRVFIEALDEEVGGTIIEISPQAEILGGDVVYKTVIELDEQPAGLLPGMSVEVDFNNP